MNDPKIADSLEALRKAVDEVNSELLAVLNRRGDLVNRIRDVKVSQGMEMFDPVREAHQMKELVSRNSGPMTPKMVEHIFREVFRAFHGQMQDSCGEGLLVTSKQGPGTVTIGNVTLGNGKPVLIAGPCAVESEEQLEAVATLLEELGVSLMRGGAFKPRSSPYTFQGLGMVGVKLLAKVAASHGLSTVSELTDAEFLGDFQEQIDVIQVGARNMYNYDFLKKLARSNRPILLKRGLSATIEEFLLSAEYLFAGGNRQVILCERGIRTFEPSTRNTLDLSAVPLLKEKTGLPVVVDVGHAAGRKDLLLPLAKAALAVGADAVMVQVHPTPASALSDAGQQLDLDAFRRFVESLQPYLG